MPQSSVLAALAVATLSVSVPIDSGPGGTEAAPGLTSGAGYTVYGALADVPMPPSGDAEPPSMFLVTGDVVTAAEHAGIELPDPATATADELGATWFRLSGASGGPPDEEPDWAPIPLLGPGIIVDVTRWDLDETRAAVGWTLADVTAFAERPTPPYSFTAVAGDFDDSTLPSSLPAVADGVVTLGEGEDMTVNLAEPTVLDPQGRPQRLAQRDGVIAFGLVTEEVARWAAGTTADVVVDDPGVAALARTLDDHDAASAVIGGMGIGLTAMLGSGATPERIAAVEAAIADTSISTPIDLVAIGWSADTDGNSQITVAYHVVGGAAAADEAAAQVERTFAAGVSVISDAPLSDEIVLDDVEVADGIVVATLSPADGRPPITVFNMLQRRDLPFVVV